MLPSVDFEDNDRFWGQQGQNFVVIYLPIFLTLSSKKQQFWGYLTYLENLPEH